MLPDVNVIPHPVFPPAVSDGDWWKQPESFALVALEYSKYLVALVRQAILQVPSR